MHFCPFASKRNFSASARSLRNVGLFMRTRSHTHASLHARTHARMYTHVERGSSVGRTPDSQSREPGFESPENGVGMNRSARGGKCKAL